MPCCYTDRYSHREKKTVAESMCVCAREKDTTEREPNARTHRNVEKQNNDKRTFSEWYIRAVFFTSHHRLFPFRMNVERIWESRLRCVSVPLHQHHIWLVKNILGTVFIWIGVVCIFDSSLGFNYTTSSETEKKQTEKRIKNRRIR